VSQKKGQSAVDARKGDENKTARALLKKSKVEVVDRFVSPKPLGHNKFMVVTDANKKPIAAWTGSTNWTATGLCTQINNGFLVENAAFAQTYLDQWDSLRGAGSTFPDSLVSSNGTAKPKKVGQSATRTWFTPTKKKVDLAALDEVIQGAEDAILFLMFQPGGKATFATLRKRFDSPGKLYIKGIVSTLPSDKPDPAHVDVSIVGDGIKRPLGLDIVQPEGISAPFSSWAATVTRNDFIPTQGGVVGFAIVHSKLIVVDPFTKPVVVTGSHNFSDSASQSNDENFVIVRGNQTLALEYSAHILAVYQHYRWLKLLRDAQEAKKKNPSKKGLSGVLDETGAWQARQLKGPSKKEIEFWVR
jgi:phosphatidylserine/phosphatidylglycerophosphate/cardiolipin synthase-like enzyme